MTKVTKTPILSPIRQNILPISWEDIEKTLERYEFPESDELFLRYSKNIGKTGKTVTDYENVKAKHIGEFLAYRFRKAQSFDEYQLSAIATTRKNTIVSARAGSWKTQVIAGKIAFEIESGNMLSSEILALSFNAKAAAEMLGRVRSESKGFGIDSFHNAMTFHSLAYKIVQPKENILIDVVKYEHPVTGEEIEIDTEKQKIFIRDSLIEIFDWALEKTMVKYFSRDLAEFKKDALTDDDETYLLHRKRHPNLSYSGSFVRSKGEKYLLDLLVWCGFTDIEYEPPIVIPDQNEYYLKKADAVCRFPGVQLPIYIEHWGMDEQSWESPDHWWMTKEQYLNNRNLKREYFRKLEKQWKIIFLETSYADSIGNSELSPRTTFYSNVKVRFENQLWKKFEEIDKKTLIGILRNNDRRIPKFIWKIQRYINFAQLGTKSPNDMQWEIDSLETGEVRSFLNLANAVYRRYENRKMELWQSDFNTLLKNAVEKIEKEGDRLSIVTRMKNIPISVLDLKSLKCVIVDEYQDFSTLFYRIIQAISKYNHDFKLFVVGDDWQSINQFAGADIKYFFQFQERFDNVPTAEKALNTNYRSRETIVEFGNLLMSELGHLAIPSKNNLWGVPPRILTSYIAKLEYAKYSELLEKALPSWNQAIGKSMWEARKAALWYMARTINDVESLNDPKAKAFVISRNNDTYGMSKNEWVRSLKRLQWLFVKNGISSDTQKAFDRFLDEGRFEILTAHKSKGKQADAVLLLDVSQYNYPRFVNELRADSEYFSIFGETPDNQLLNARKLLYVGITRAKSVLRILTDDKKPSGYLKEITNRGEFSKRTF